MKHRPSSLQSVQNKSARWILSDYHRTASMISMKLSLSLLNLTLRTYCSPLSLFYKTFHHSLMCHCLLTHPLYISRHLDQQNKFGVLSCNTNAFFHSSIPCTSSIWSRLPHRIPTIHDQATLKKCFIFFACFFFCSRHDCIFVCFFFIMFPAFVYQYPLYV